MTSTSDITNIPSCTFCGGYHSGVCSRVEEIEYFENGTIRRVKLRTYEPPPPPPPPYVPYVPYAPPFTYKPMCGGTANAVDKFSGTVWNIAF